MRPSERPLIGLTTSEVRTRKTLRPIPHGEPTPHEFALGVWYPQAIEEAGGMPVILPPTGKSEAEALVERLDGICLPGGPDLHPDAYGAEPHPQLGPTDREVDRFEFDVIACADRRGMPILGICRGAQALNVARGGTLIQHLPDLATGLLHRQTGPGNETTHPVEVVPDSRLAAIVGAGELPVNTFHHQGIERLGEGLRAVAFAPDETVEGIEGNGDAFLLGVQWHAETLIEQGRQLALFRALVEAAAGSPVGAAAG